MTCKLLLAAALTAIAAPALAQSGQPAPAAPAAAPKETSIPFVRTGNIDDFEADGTKGVWLRTIDRKWYYASVIGPCFNLDFAQRIGVAERGVDQLDQFGTLLVDGQRCSIQSLVASDGPPKAHKKARS